MKHWIVHLLQKYFLNPPIKFLLAIGIAPPGYALLETIGRKTGKPRRTPVGDGRIGSQFWIVAEHGGRRQTVRSSMWRGPFLNFFSARGRSFLKKPPGKGPLKLWLSGAPPPPPLYPNSANT